MRTTLRHLRAFYTADTSSRGCVSETLCAEGPAGLWLRLSQPEFLHNQMVLSQSLGRGAQERGVF